jgi:hypothetical protein
LQHSNLNETDPLGALPPAAATDKNGWPSRHGPRPAALHELLGHRQVTTKQIYDKRRRQAHEGASHDILI